MIQQQKNMLKVVCFSGMAVLVKANWKVDIHYLAPRHACLRRDNDWRALGSLFGTHAKPAAGLQKDRLPPNKNSCRWNEPFDSHARLWLWPRNRKWASCDRRRVRESCDLLPTDENTCVGRNRRRLSRVRTKRLSANVINKAWHDVEL